MEINDMHDAEFKLMVMKILTALEKRVENVNENLNKGKKNIKKRTNQK